MSDKLITRSTEIAPVDDFAKRVEEELRKRGEEPAQRTENRECYAAFKFEENIISRCKCKPGHDGEHGNAMLSWRVRCTSIEQGEQCRYQLDHPGSHMDVREEMTWTDDKPAVVGDTGGDAFGIIGEVLRNNTAFQQAFANKLKQRAPIMQRVPPSKARQYQLAFGPVLVPGGATETIYVQPQCLFRGKKLIVGSNAASFVLDTLLVGVRMQMPIASGIPASAFTADRIDNGITMDTCAPGLAISMQVRNITSKEEMFDAVIIGEAVH